MGYGQSMARGIVNGRDKGALAIYRQIKRELAIEREPVVECSCGCGALKPDDGRCECGRPLGHS